MVSNVDPKKRYLTEDFGGFITPLQKIPLY
jgi:hypothetical protein